MRSVNRVHFDELRVRRHAESAMVADLRYGDLWVPTVLAARGAHLELECEVVDPGDAPRLAAAREWGMRRARVVQVLRGVMLEQIDEGAGNAGRPTLRTWARESQRTPRRTIEHRIRPRLEWLEGIVDPQRLPAEEPPPLAYGPR